MSSDNEKRYQAVCDVDWAFRIAFDMHSDGMHKITRAEVVHIARMILDRLSHLECTEGLNKRGELH